MSGNPLWSDEICSPAGRHIPCPPWGSFNGNPTDKSCCKRKTNPPSVLPPIPTILRNVPPVWRACCLRLHIWGLPHPSVHYYPPSSSACSGTVLYESLPKQSRGRKMVSPFVSLLSQPSGFRTRATEFHRIPTTRIHLNSPRSPCGFRDQSVYHARRLHHEGNVDSSIHCPTAAVRPSLRPSWSLSDRKNPCSDRCLVEFKGDHLPGI